MDDGVAVGADNRHVIKACNLGSLLKRKLMLVVNLQRADSSAL